MPEMPEIETLARQLRKTILGKRIEDVRLSGLPLRKPVSETFPAKLRGRTIRNISRRGKYLVAELEPKAFWLIHLGMSGRILYRSTSSAVATRHAHAIIRFSDATELEYCDPRRFGLLAAYEVLRLGLVPELRSLGRDPLSPGFHSEWLSSLLRKSRQEIKSFLLDQSKIAGLGNIYACESLFLARIHPARRCLTLKSEETSRLAVAIRKVLRAAVENNGTSFSDFRDSSGNRGNNQRFLKIFQREGEACVRCKSLVRRMRQGNRSTFYCPHCQF
jgi:formamidopyrimidine-DNA glycosylase